MRYADRNQTVRYSTFNWTPIAANWNCNGAGFNADNTRRPNPAAACDLAISRAMARASSGHTASATSTMASLSQRLTGLRQQGALTNYDLLMRACSGATTNSPIPPGYTPICDRAGRR